MRQRRIIVLIDESGLFERPYRARTWAPKGETPVLQYRFSWKQLSVIAGISYWRFYFRLFNGSIKSPKIVEFLKALQATIGKKLLIIRRSPGLSSTTIWSLIPTDKEIGREEAVYRRADHRLPA